MINKRETNKIKFLDEQALIKYSHVTVINIHTIHIIRISAKCDIDQENMPYWSASNPSCQFRLLHLKQIGGNAKDGQGCHHLLPSTSLKQGPCRHLPLHT